MAAVSFSSAARLVPSLGTATSIPAHKHKITCSASAPLRTNKAETSGAAPKASLCTPFLGASLPVRGPTPIKSIAAKPSSERPGFAVAKDRMNPGETLGSDQALFSPNGYYQLIMQRDNNLVIYDLRNGRRPLWASNTMDNANPGQSFCVFQTDGNLVTYKGGINSPTWASNTGGIPASHVIMQGDGNLVIYNGSKPTWASNTQQG